MPGSVHYTAAALCWAFCSSHSTSCSPTRASCRRRTPSMQISSVSGATSWPAGHVPGVRAALVHVLHVRSTRGRVPRTPAPPPNDVDVDGCCCCCRAASQPASIMQRSARASASAAAACAHRARSEQPYAPGRSRTPQRWRVVYGCVRRQSVIHTSDPLWIPIQSVRGTTHIGSPMWITDSLQTHRRRPPGNSEQLGAQLFSPSSIGSYMIHVDRLQLDCRGGWARRHCLQRTCRVMRNNHINSLINPIKCMR